MPAAVPVIAGISAFATGSLGGAIITGAIVGAAIGGISAAITGGDIGKGILFGAVGGAVTGAVTFGLSSVLSSTGTGARAAFHSTQAGSGVQGVGGLVGDTSVTALGREAATSSVTQLTGSTALKTGAAAASGGGGGSGFLSKLGKSLGGGFGQAAVGAGIGAVKDVYMGKKAAELQMSEAEKDRELKREELRSLEKRAGMGRGGGGGGGGGGPDYTIDELILRDRKAAEEERKSVLAKVSAELDAQKSLNRQEWGELAEARGRAAAGAAVSTGGGARSRSTETIVDVQERIRAGEDAQGNPNLGVIPPVEYVPPGQASPEEQVA